MAKHIYRVGADENGLGARLGPMIVTGVFARVTPSGQRFLARRLPARFRAKLDDSKRLISHQDSRLGEAWARALFRNEASSPAELLARLTLESAAELRAPCPKRAQPQCWTEGGETFQAPEELVEELGELFDLFSERGVEVLDVKCSVLCTKILNRNRRTQENRFITDLHAMERLVLFFREQAQSDLVAVCGKVGGIVDYPKFFGPLSGWLHSVRMQVPERSVYSIPSLGELSFLRDADASDPLVMLASLVGKYLRELLMARISAFYAAAQGDNSTPSGYHDPITKAFVDKTRVLRRSKRIPTECFERVGPSTKSERRA